ncbi:MAG: DUF3592 domain-containing protein [Hyphomicrobiales bacterium]
MLSASALLWTRIWAAVALFFVVNLAYAVLKARRQASSSSHWPIAKGEVIASKVQVPKVHSSDEDTDCSAEIRYRYHVGGKDHEGSHIHAGRDAMTTRQFAEEIAARYPLGSSVDVHYRPDRPGTAVLEPKDGGNIAALVVFLAVSSFTAAILIAHSIAGKVLLMREGGVPLFALIVPLAFSAMGIGAVYEYRRMHRKMHESAHWPTAPGTITASEVVEFEETSKDDKGHETTTTNYRADIRFAYKVGGREFHSSQWQWGWTAIYLYAEGAQKIVDAHPAGKSVLVYYDPRNPETAVLEPGNKKGTFVPLVVALVCGGGGVLMFWAFTVLHQ